MLLFLFVAAKRAVCGFTFASCSFYCSYCFRVNVSPMSCWLVSACMISSSWYLSLAVFTCSFLLFQLYSWGQFHGGVFLDGLDKQYSLLAHSHFVVALQSRADRDQSVPRQDQDFKGPRPSQTQDQRCLACCFAYEFSVVKATKLRQIDRHLCSQTTI